MARSRGKASQAQMAAGPAALGVVAKAGEKALALARFQPWNVGFSKRTFAQLSLVKLLLMPLAIPLLTMKPPRVRRSVGQAVVGC